MARKTLRKNYIIRNCKPKEISQIIQLLKTTGLFWEDGDTKEAFLKKLEFDPNSIMVLIYKEKIIGTVMYVYDPWCSSLWHLTIEPQHQNKGLGHLLANEAEKRLKELGTACIAGYVAPDNKNSLSFLKKRKYKRLPHQVIPAYKTV